jgi:hypothetical protein
VRLAVGQATGHGRPDAGRDLRVEHVRVERDVDEAGPGHVIERLVHCPLDTDAIDLAHREYANAGMSAQQLAFGRIERACADDGDAALVDHGKRPGVAREPVAREAEGRGKRHAVNVAGRAGGGNVEIAVGIEPDHAARAAVRGSEPTERAEGDGVVAAEHEGQRIRLDRVAHEHRDLRAGREDLGQVARGLVRHGRRLRLGRLDVPEVPHPVAERDQPLLQIRVAKRGGPHVDTPATLAEVERSADDRNGLRGHGCGA